MKDYQKALTSIQMGIWEAEYMISQQCKVDFWTGRISGLKIAFFSLKAIGFKTDFIKELVNPYQ